MLDMNDIRRQMAEYLAENASHRHSIDAAVMHVVQIAYRKGMADAVRENDNPVDIVIEIDGKRLPVTDAGTDFRTWRRDNLELLAADLTRRMVADAKARQTA